MTLRDIDVIRALYLFLLLSLLTASYAAAEDTPDGGDEVIIDEVTVIGARELLSIRMEIVRAEEEITRIFNELNDDDDYDMICESERPVGTRISRRVCRARAYREAMTEDAKRAMDGLPMTGVMLNTKKHNEILQEKLRSLVMENPELEEAVVKRYVLRQKYERAHANKFD